MAYFYVRDHADGIGTATGDGGRTAAVQTGDWDTVFSATTQYYVSMVAAFAATTPPVSGDVVICSHIHDHNYGASPTVTVPDGVIIMSVNDVVIEDYLAGASEECTGGNFDFKILSVAGNTKFIKGLTITAQDDLIVSSTTDNTSTYIEECVLKCSGNSVGDKFIFSAAAFDSIFVEMINTDCQLPLVSSAGNVAIDIQSGIVLRWLGGALLDGGTNVHHVFTFTGAAGGQVYAEGVDFTNINTNGFIAEIDAVIDDTANVTLVNCLIPDDVSLNTVALLAPNQRIEAYGCGADQQYYSYRIEDYYGSVVEETTVIRTASAQYDADNEVSLKVSPIVANTVTAIKGLHFHLGGKYKDLSVNQTVTVYLINDNAVSAATALTVSDVQLRVKTPDNTNQVLAQVNTVHVQNVLNASPTALTTDSDGSSNWEGTTPANAKYYVITYAIGALSNITNGLVEVSLEMMPNSLDANDQIYVCPDFTLTDT